MLHPNHFEINEAWIAFWLNDGPIQTAHDGAFNCVCLMDAASCYLLGNAMAAADETEPSQAEAKRLLKAGWEHKKSMPETLFVPKGQFKRNLTNAAQTENINVVPVEEGELLVFIRDAKESFKAHVQGSGERR
jgi:hypothetical protein